ncbi:MAG: hypothetical protein ACYC6W_10865 [Nitrosotalea sp.]
MLKFKTIENHISTYLTDILKKDNLNPSDFTFIKGFINPIIQSELGERIEMTFSSVPMIGISKKSTGELKFYALKAILPDIEI